MDRWVPQQFKENVISDKIKKGIENKNRIYSRFAKQKRKHLKATKVTSQTLKVLTCIRDFTFHLRKSNIDFSNKCGICQSIFFLHPNQATGNHLNYSYVSFDELVRLFFCNLWEMQIHHEHVKLESN